MGSEPLNDLAFAEQERKAELLRPTIAPPVGEFDALLQAPVGGVQLFGTGNPLEALDKAEALIQRVQQLVEKARDRYIARIPGPHGVKDYPKVDWWTSVGFALNLVPRLAGDVTEGKPGNFTCTIEVWHLEKGIMVTRAQGFCSMAERTPKGNARWNDEYAARAMAQTRGIGRAFRGPLGGLAALAGLEATPAEEMTGVHDTEKPASPAKAASARPAPPAEAAKPAPKPAADMPTGLPPDIAAVAPDDLVVGRYYSGTLASLQPESDWWCEGNPAEQWHEGMGERGMKLLAFEGLMDGKWKKECATTSNPHKHGPWKPGDVLTYRLDAISQWLDVRRKGTHLKADGKPLKSKPHMIGDTRLASEWKGAPAPVAEEPLAQDAEFTEDAEGEGPFDPRGAAGEPGQEQPAAPPSSGIEALPGEPNIYRLKGGAPEKDAGGSAGAGHRMLEPSGTQAAPAAPKVNVRGLQLECVAVQRQLTETHGIDGGAVVKEYEDRFGCKSPYGTQDAGTLTRMLAFLREWQGRCVNDNADDKGL